MVSIKISAATPAGGAGAFFFATGESFPASSGSVKVAVFNYVTGATEAQGSDQGCRHRALELPTANKNSKDHHHHPPSTVN